jgi:hypothetical protein
MPFNGASPDAFNGRVGFLTPPRKVVLSQIIGMNGTNVAGGIRGQQGGGTAKIGMMNRNRKQRAAMRNEEVLAHRGGSCHAA